MSAEITIATRLRKRLGEDVVLLNVASGEKRPVEKGWQKFTVEKMRDASYLNTLSHGGNIGVLLGKNSGGIHTIDVDLDAAVDPFLALNPKLAATFRTKRVRGCNLWLRVTGACPPSGKLKTTRGKDWGEWRGDGNQTVIFGQAIDRKKGETKPTRYQVVNCGAVVTMAFEEIIWPQDLVLPWSCRGPGSVADCDGNKPDKADVASMLAFIPPRPNYSEWLRVVAAVGDALGDDDAIEVLNEWSPEEEPGEYHKKLRSGMDQVRIGTLIHLARENGWTPPAPEPPFDAYYEINRRVYLVRNAGGRWLPFEEGQFKKRLRNEGIRAKAHDGENLAPTDQVLLWLQDHRDVNYAAPLAGRASGFYEDNGARYLVTASPHFIVPEKGDWSTLYALLENLFWRNEPEHAERQWHTVLTWLKGTVEALRAGMPKEAQALALAGPVQSGKSLFQRLITHLLGGRECKPFLFMSGKTPFNAELFEAEHLALEDEHMSRRLSDRLALAAAIKGIVANEAHSCHRKNCTPITLRPFWRLTLTLNDEPEALLVLPPLDEHVADKILLLRASRFPLPMPTMTKDERAAFWKCLIGELPAFLHFLLHEYQAPVGYTDARYVVAAWHHPYLTAALHDLSPAAALLALIDQLAPWVTADGKWEGTAEELRAHLFQHPATALDARRLLEWTQACGNYLATLAKKNPERVRLHRTNKARLWIIRKP